MPCYAMIEIGIKISQKNISFLLSALDSMNLKYSSINGSIELVKYNIRFSPKEGKAVFSSERDRIIVNQIMQNVSYQIVNDAAKKKGFSVKRNGKKLELRRTI